MGNQDKTTEIFGLSKIPDKDIIKHQSIEIGKLKSNIDELQYILKDKEKLLNLYNTSDNVKLLNINNDLKKQLLNLKKKITKRSISNASLKEDNDSYRRQIVVLKDELFQKLKKDFKK